MASPIPVLDQQDRMLVVVGLGTIGGLFIGYQAVQHLFVEGVTSEERKGVLMYSAAALAAWGLTKLVDLGEYSKYVDVIQLISGAQEAKSP